MELRDDALGAYLESIGQKRPDETLVRVAAGDGNINFVRRLRVGGRPLVLKQARGALERFPEYRVTTERIVFEHRYMTVVAELAPAVAGVLPRVIHFDEEGRVLVMEDLGPGPRLEEELVAGRVPVAALEELGGFLGRVHAATAAQAAALDERFRNGDMRALHGEHIFRLPFEPNDFPIPPAVRAWATRALERPGVRKQIDALRARYYDTPLALVHGDVQGTNVLLQDGRPRLLDAEIAHVGDPAFDLGTALAHVQVHEATGLEPERSREGVQALVRAYGSAGGREEHVERAADYAAVELLRRTLGAARFSFLTEEAARKIVELAADRLGPRGS